MERQSANPSVGSRWDMMRNLQEIGLTLADLTEYLDTHVNDTFASTRLQTAAAEYRQIMERYEQLFGPLTPESQCADGDKCQWALGDFPWDYEL